jgi:hypothetical protein
VSTSVRKEVADFLALGPLPRSQNAEPAHVERLGEALSKISMPVSDDEAAILASAFGPDECFGLAWTLVHLIESAPEGAPLARIPQSENEWVELLRERAASGQRRG